MTGNGESMVQSLSPAANFTYNDNKKGISQGKGGLLKFNTYQMNPSNDTNRSSKKALNGDSQDGKSNKETRDGYSEANQKVPKAGIEEYVSNDLLPLQNDSAQQDHEGFDPKPEKSDLGLRSNHNPPSTTNKLHYSVNSGRSSLDFRKKSSELFLHLRDDGLAINTNNANQFPINLSSPSTPTTPRISTVNNAHSPQQQQRSSRPPFLASKHSQIIPVLSVNDVVANSHPINSNGNHATMSTAHNHTPSGSVYSKSARNSMTNFNHPVKDELTGKILYPIIDPNAIKEYQEATKPSEIEVIDYKNKEKTLLENDRDVSLVKHLPSKTNNTESCIDFGAVPTTNHADIKSVKSKTDAKDNVALGNVKHPAPLFVDDFADDNYSETIIDGHTNFTIAYNMLSGIKTSVNKYQERVDKKLRYQKSKGNQNSLVDIKESDFTNTEKLKFVHKDKLFYSFKFKDYAPQIFSNLRGIFNIEHSQYLESLTSKYVLSELNSPGKSGSFFYYSPDNKYIIKTIRRAEHKHLRTHLKEYYEHCEGNPETLLSQFYGLYRMKLPISLKFTNPPKSRRIYFIVMNNVFPIHIDQSFDLKGSLLGRITNVPQRNDPPRQRSLSKSSQMNSARSHSVVQALDDSDNGQINANDDSQDTIAPLTLKDLNWLDNSMRLELDMDISHDLKAQLNRDVALLKRLNTMDYSLLIGIHFANSQDFYYSDELLSKSIASKDGSKLYFIGIIDCLTNYSFLKKVETFFKSVTHSKNDISAVPPEMYGRRFVNFIEQNVLPVDKDNSKHIIDHIKKKKTPNT